MAPNSLKHAHQYGGIDFFRLLAAMLIVANHTSPLLTFDPTADFILTRIVARVGVPFFFMATGFFLLPRIIGESNHDLCPFMIKTAKLYVAAMLLYIPVLVYKGYFSEPGLPLVLLQDIVFDGTLYHLWYLPAVMLGVWIVFLLLRAFTIGTAFGITVLLYLIALFGDSYYGIAENVPFAKAMYDCLFQVFDYTRNGLFFAPLYLLLGGVIALKKWQLPRKTALAGLSLSLVLMLVEGLILHHFHMQRHDSMYVMLLPVMFFLFQWLLTFKGASNRHWRTISMAVYIIHPLCIIIVRGFAKVTGLGWLLVDNSLMHYLAVVLLSFACSVIMTLLLVRKKGGPSNTGRAWMEINLDHLRHNVKALQRLLPHNCDIMAVVKANAYGHGDIAIANELCKIGVRAFAVATVSEGIRLRQNGIKGDILVMGYSHPDELPQLIRYRLIQTVIDEDYARVLNECGKTIRVHVKIDTGMARLGEAYDNISALRSVYTCQHLSVEGIYTHLAVSDSLAPDDVAFTRRQLRRFHGAVEQIRKMGFDPGKMHVQSSYGVLNDAREESYDLARIGIAMYGVLSRPGERTKHSVDLRPVLALKARVAAVKELEAGNAVGYGRAFVARRPTRIAVLAIGYADGIPRSLSGIGAVLIHGKRAPIVGLICMDQMMVDVTEIAETRAGDVVTLIGQDGAEEISAEQMAAAAGTITNEWLSRLGSRLERVTV